MRTLKLKHGTWSVDENRPLGEPGGFGAVYEGTDAVGMSVAVKLLHKKDDTARELEFAEYFFAKPAKHVVPILDFGVDAIAGDTCVVMQRAETNLRSKLKSAGTFSEFECVAILIDLARGLIEAGGWVHRDLKPDNALLFDGRWHLADFGLARQIDAATVTHTVRFCMTLPYAAPEQINGMRATHETDIYALGCIGAELLNGKYAFPGPNFGFQHLHQTPVIENASPKLQALLLRMMAKPIEARPDAEDVLRELEEIRTPRIPGGSGATRLQHAVTRHNDHVAREEAKRIEGETRQQHRAQLMEAARAELAAIGQRLTESIHAFVPSASRPLPKPPNDSLSLPRHPSAPVQKAQKVQHQPALQVPVVEKLNNVQVLGRYGSGNIALTSNMMGVADGQFSLVDWDVFIGAVVAVWQHDCSRSASLWYASIAGRKPRWFEVAYRHPSIGWFYPTALQPGLDAATAINVESTSGWGLSYPIRDLSAGDGAEFVDRWLGWFGDAVEAKLQEAPLPDSNTTQSA